MILVTHQLQFLEFVDQIVLLSNGKIESTGSYENLLQSGLDFSKLLAAPVEKDDDNVSEKPPTVDQIVINHKPVDVAVQAVQIQRKK